MAKKALQPTRLKAGLMAILMAALADVAGAQTPEEVGQWGPVRDVPVGPTHSIVLPTGKVLFFGEFHKGDRHFEYDPITDTITELSYAGFNIFCSGHAHLENGFVFITGGHIDEHIGEPQSVIYDPYNRTWIPVPVMNDGRWYPTATTLPNGEVLVVGGETHGAGINNPVHQVYQPKTNTWRDLTEGAADLPYYTRQFVDLNGDVIIVTPRARNYLIETEGAGKISNLGLTTTEVARTYGGAVMYETGKILIAGGGVPPTETVELLDLNSSNETWRQVQSMSIARRQHNTVILPDGRVWVTGGSSGALFDDRTNPVFHTEVWDPETETWTTWASHAMYRGYHSTAVLLPDGRIFTGGGRHDDTMEIFSPPYLFQGSRPTVTFAPEYVEPGQPFAVLTPNAGDIKKVTLIRLGATTHAFDQNQRFSSLEFVPFTGGLIAKAPPNNNVVPPGPYMLFVIDENGIPSVAEMVRVEDVTSPPIGIGDPSGGEIFLADTFQMVKWWADAPTSRVDLELSLDGGSTWTVIERNIPNTGAYEWHVPTEMSSDVRLRITDSDDPSRVAINPARFSVHLGPMRDFVSFGDTWAYHADGTFPGEGWNQPGFSDGSWDEGKAKFGYGRGNEVTVLPMTTPAQTSVYFRKEFEVSGSVLGLHLSALYDDGIAVWLNGTLIFERLMDDGMEHEVYASSSVNDEMRMVMVDTDLLVSGTNTLAAMVKQNGPTSPDLSFDASLAAVVPQTFSIDIITPKAGAKYGPNQEVEISWDTEGYAPHVDIEVSTNGGSSWTVLEDRLVNTGTYTWHMPSTPTSDMKLRVYKSLDRSVYDESGSFSVRIPVETEIFPMGSEWKYHEDGTFPGPDWNLASYDDSDWDSGRGEFGYGDGDETTVLMQTTPAQTTVYFRKTIDLSDYVSSATLFARYDDGIAVYVNGELVMTRGIGSFHHERYGVLSVSNAEAEEVILGHYLKPGKNLIAVMVKQVGGTSIDLSFDLGLTVDLLP